MPRNDYGVGKAAGEALCASLAVTSETTFVSARIGNYARSDPRRRRRCGTGWRGSSPRDAAQLLRLALTVPVDGHLVVHGVSDNHPKQLSIDATRRALGYRPVDDAFA